MGFFTLNALTEPLSSSQGLEHAALQSILNHGQSTSNDRARMQNNERGGCWSEAFSTLVGSRNWTLEREKNLPEVRQMAEKFVREALQWMVDEKLLRDVNVSVTEHSTEGFQYLVLLYPQNGEVVEVEI